ncbi:MAG: O-antigen ligase family protein [Flavobacteriales bacterium]
MRAFSRADLRLFFPVALAAALPLHPRASTLVLAVWAAAFVVRSVREQCFPRSGFPGLWVAGPLVYYTLHVAGVLWSEHTAEAWFALEVKLGLIAVPLLGSWEWTRLDAADRRRLLPLLVQVFGAALAVRVGFSLLRVTLHALETGLPEFTYAALSHPFHPSYLALYATVWWILARPRAAQSTGVGVLLGMLQSKAGLLVGAAGAVGLGLGLNRTWRRAALGIALGCAVGVAAAGALGRSRMEAASSGAPSGSTSGRLQAWTAAVEVIAEAPGGVGTGDVVPALVERYTASGADYARTRKMNAHSTYLQTAVATGLLGLLVVLVWWGACAWDAARRKAWPAFAVVGVIAAHGVVESLLELQQGVVGVAFFLTWGLAAATQADCEAAEASD